MALQTTLNRVGALVLGSSHFTFAMVVAVFVLSIALGSFAVSALRSIPRALVVWSQCALVAALFALYFALDDAGYWAHWIRVRLGGLDARFADYQLAIFGSTLALLALPIGLSGALLPLLFHAQRGEARDLGAVAGRLYAWNTLGSLLGALLGGYLLLIWLDLHHVYRIALACVAVSAWVLSALVPSRVPRVAAALALLLALAATALLPAWHADHVTPGTFRARRPDPRAIAGAEAFFATWSYVEIVFYDDDPTSSVAVAAPFRRPENLALFVNGKPEGALQGDHATMALTALIPAWLAERNARCFVVGLGTGVTAGELAALQSTRQITVAEISRAVIAASPLFSAGNLGAIKSPKLEIVRGDAYRTLLRSPGRYDLIVSEPSNPWVAGVDTLYTVEFLEAVRERLEPGGVFAQWFHGYESSPEIVELIIRNYVSVFRESSIWFTSGTDLLLLGIQREPRSLDMGALEARFDQPDFRAAFARARIESLPQLLAHELVPFGTLRAGDLAGTVHSLRKPILSDLAARAFFAGRRAVIGLFASDTQRRTALANSSLRRYAGDSEVLPEGLYELVAEEICARRRDQECATLIARWALDHPDSERLRASLASLRKSAQRRDSPFAPQRLERVKELFDGELARGGDAEIDSLEAQRATELFEHLYHHVFPFEIGALERTWQRCGGAECAAG
ncbi:MAG TPA: fused MFS/spermidine synthase, partial [Myxococcota bacterium]|nr:fused MFS/spermidine synthase [Myxococcota bacterium]